MQAAENESKKQNEEMTPTQQTDTPSEVYAASAAEGAIMDVAKPAIPDDHLQTEKQPGQPDAKSQSNEAESKQQEAGEVTTVRADQPTTVDMKSGEGDIQVLDTKPQTKEEMIEEALNCPCIDSMKEGSCGDPFISAYKCFLQSETEPKGMDCMEQFKSMQSCIAEHPEEYNMDDSDDESDERAGATDSPFPIPADTSTTPPEPQSQPQPQSNPSSTSHTTNPQK